MLLPVAQIMPQTSVLGLLDVRLNKYDFHIHHCYGQLWNRKTSHWKTNRRPFLLRASLASFYKKGERKIFQNHEAFGTIRERKIVLAAYRPSLGMFQYDKYRRLEGCLIIPPVPSQQKPRGIVKFLGGAFIGAVPDVFYSNGALLQALEGCYSDDKLPDANVLIAFNNKPAAEAVPYFEQVGPVAAQLSPVFAASPFMEMATTASGDIFKSMVAAVGAMLEQYDPNAIASLSRFSEQLPLVMNQITEGTSEFKPSPSENRDTIRTRYSVPRTLLVKFSFDAIDETDQLEMILKSRVEAIGGVLSKVALNGTHVTPCVQDMKWSVGDVYTPADAVAQVLKSAALNDIRALVKTIVHWFGDAS